MGWIDTLLQREPATVQREAAPVRVTMVGPPDVGFLTSVTPTTSLSLSAVWRCLDVLSNGVSQLPWREVLGDGLQTPLEIPPSRLVRQPQAGTTRREWVSLVVSILALYDWCYLLKAGGADSNGPSGLWPINPLYITSKSNDPVFMQPAAEYYVGTTLLQREELVILRRSPQPLSSDNMAGLLKLARTTFAAALAADQYASRFWQAGGLPTQTLETDLHLNTTEAREVQDRYAEKRAQGPDYVPVLSGGMSLKQQGADPTTASAVEARREMVADIARYFGVPTRMVNAPTGDSETYSTTESANLDLKRFTLQNYIGAIEDAISEQLPAPRRMVMDASPLTMGTQLTRAQTWQLAGAAQAWMSADEIRAAEGLPPLELPLQSPPLQSPQSGGGNSSTGSPDSTMMQTGGQNRERLPEQQS